MSETTYPPIEDVKEIANTLDKVKDVAEYFNITDSIEIGRFNAHCKKEGLNIGAYIRERQGKPPVTRTRKNSSNPKSKFPPIDTTGMKDKVSDSQGMGKPFGKEIIQYSPKPAQELNIPEDSPPPPVTLEMKDTMISKKEVKAFLAGLGVGLGIGALILLGGLI